LGKHGAHKYFSTGNNHPCPRTREEIQRIKAANPEMPHREAFSTAAKNVSFFNLLILAPMDLSLLAL
jgi:hypothetical protein